MSLRVAILDFDGTLVESVGIKDRAFERLYADSPQLPEIIEYHLANNHTIRFEKFRHIATEILGVEYDDAVEADLSARFSALVADEIAAAPEVVGASELLDALTTAGVSIYLLSMSPAGELIQILERRGTDARFTAVYAHPWTKAGAIADILARESARPDEAVMVGDTPEDAEAALSSNVRFIGRDSGKTLPGEVPVFADMGGVLDYLTGEAILKGAAHG